jgi:hypothetical protein
VIVRSVACFRSTLPEDFIETEDGEGFVQPPGKSVADALAVIFKDLGFQIYFGPEPLSDFVWGFGVERAGRSFPIGLNLVDDYVLTFPKPSWIDSLLGRKPVAYLALLLGTSRALASDERFSNIRWFTDRESKDLPGAATPWEIDVRR